MHVEYVTIKENVGLAEEVEFDLCGFNIKTVSPDLDKYLLEFDRNQLRDFIKEKKAMEEVKFDLVVRKEANETIEFYLFWMEHDGTDGAYKTWDVRMIM